MNQVDNYNSSELQKLLKEFQKIEKRKQKEQNKEDVPFDRKVVLFVLIVSLIVLSISFFIVYKTGVEPSTTVTAWFGFGGVEVWALAFLRKNKRKNETILKRKELEENERI